MTWAQRRVLSDPVFSGRVSVGAGPHDCWEWQGCRVKAGYGRVRAKGKSRWAHRWARYVAFGDQPEAVCHTCDNPPCVNPEHLRSGTLSDNTAEMWAKGRARVQYANALLLDGGAEAAVAAMRLLGRPYAPGRRQRMDALAAQMGVSVRTLYRLASAHETPQVCRARIRRASNPGTHQEEIAA